MNRQGILAKRWELFKKNTNENDRNKIKYQT